ncbi:MAG: glycosyltransferase family 39 protein, partial [Planctomycetota bacterium]
TENLAPGSEVTPTAYWAVGAPAVYAACFKLFGHTYAPIVAVNILANVLTIALLMKLAARWTTGRHAAVAGLCLAIWPGQVTFVTLMASELLFAFGMVAVIYAWSRRDWNAWWRIPLVGVLLGLTCLVRPTALLFPVLLVIIDVAQREGFLKPVIQAAVASLIMVAVVLPWSLRNERVLGEFVLVSANSGANLWMGNHPGTDGGYADLPPEAVAMSEIERDVYLKAIAKDYIKAEPVAFAKRTLVKAVKLHDRETIGILWNERGIEQRFGSAALVTPLKLASTGYWWLMFGGGLAGMLMLWWRGGAVRGFFAMLFHPAVVFWGYFLSVHAVVVIQDRYHWPSVPFIAVLAALPLVAWGERIITKNKNSNSRAAAQTATDPAAATTDPMTQGATA